MDTTGGFCAARLAQLVSLQQRHQPSNTSQETQRAALCSVRCVRAFDVHAALRLIDDLRAGVGLAPGEAATSHGDSHPSLLILDSVTALLSPVLTTKHSQGHALMLSLASALRAFAQDCNAAVLVTNHTVSGRDGEAGSLKPALGETWKSQRACQPSSFAPTKAGALTRLRGGVCPAHIRVQLTQGPTADSVSGLNQAHYAQVTLGRGRGVHCSYLLEATGLVPLQDIR